MTDGLRKSHLRKAHQVGVSEVGLPEGNPQFLDLIDLQSSYEWMDWIGSNLFIKSGERAQKRRRTYVKETTTAM